MLEALKESPVVWAVLALLTIFSVLFAIATWIAGRKRKQFSVDRKTSEIIIAGKTQINKLHIQYNDKDIDSLSSSKFYIWNSGNTVINSTDIVSSKPLSIICKGNASILEAQIVRASEETNQFKIDELSSNKLSLSFEYVDQGEGIALQVLHTGRAKDLRFDCKIKGGKEIRFCGVTKNKKLSRFEKVFILNKRMTPLMAGYIFSILAVFPVSWIEKTSIPVWLKLVIALLLMSVFALMGSGLALIAGRSINKQFHRTIPEELVEEKRLDHKYHINITSAEIIDYMKKSK